MGGRKEGRRSGLEGNDEYISTSCVRRKNWQFALQISASHTDTGGSKIEHEQAKSASSIVCATRSKLLASTRLGSWAKRIHVQ